MGRQKHEIERKEASSVKNGGDNADTGMYGCQENYWPKA